MAVIMVTTWYPPDKATEAAKKFLEVTEKFPQESFEKNWLAGVKGDEDGITTIWLTEVERGKLEEALNLISRRLVEYFGIEGYRAKVETLMTFEEAMPLVGLEMPSA